MIDFTALMSQAETELMADDSLMRTVKTGILFSTLTAAMKQYSKHAISSTDVLAVLEILAKHGKLYDGLEVTSPSNGNHHVSTTRVENSANSVADDGHPSHLSPEEIFEQENIRATLKSQYPTWTDEEVDAVLRARMMTQNPNVVARTDEELARHEADRRNPFPGVPLGKPLDEFTVTDQVPFPSDLGPAQS